MAHEVRRPTSVSWTLGRYRDIRDDRLFPPLETAIVLSSETVHHQCREIKIGKTDTVPSHKGYDCEAPVVALRHYM